MFWVRATLPRMRVDRLMNFAWKYLVPMSMVNILAAAVWYECYIRPGPAKPFELADRHVRHAAHPRPLVPGGAGDQSSGARRGGRDGPGSCAAPVPVAAR